MYPPTFESKSKQNIVSFAILRKYLFFYADADLACENKKLDVRNFILGPGHPSRHTSICLIRWSYFQLHYTGRLIAEASRAYFQ